MKTIASLMAVTLFVFPQVARAQDARTVFAVDVSGTSTFITDQSSADAAARYVQDYVAGLDQPHGLRMVSLGDSGMARRSVDVRATVTNHRASSAQRLAQQFGGYFRSLPGLNIEAQGTTSILDFLHSLEALCAKGDATAILFTDGLEWSSSVDGRAFARGEVTLPEPKTAFLSGCHVEMLGIGQVRSQLDSDGLRNRLVPQWKAYLEAAGADPVVVSGGFFDF